VACVAAATASSARKYWSVTTPEPGRHDHITLYPLDQATPGTGVDQPVGHHGQHRLLQRLGAPAGAQLGEPPIQPQPPPQRTHRDDDPHHERVRRHQGVDIDAFAVEMGLQRRDDAL
jgi:hypothetical protein